MTESRTLSNRTAFPRRPGKHVPQRTCIGCRTTQNAHQLLRLVCTPQGILVVDIAGRMPGRGGYVCYHGDCLRKALHPAKLSHVFKRPVLPITFDEAYQSIVQLTTTRLRACLGMAQKAGAVVSGSEALQKALAQATVQCVILATDAAVARVAEYHTLCANMNIQCMTFFSREELGHCIGKSPRTAIGIRVKHFCEVFCQVFQILQQLQVS